MSQRRRKLLWQLGAALVTLQLVLLARDHGINETRTPGVALTVLGDEQPPIIRILEPGEMVKRGNRVHRRRSTPLGAHEQGAA